MEFCAIDIELANPNMGSMCQIGLVHICNGREKTTLKSFVDPDDYFHPVNQAIHNISASDTIGAPLFSDIKDEILALVDDKVVVSHTAFDRAALRASCDRYGLEEVAWTWLDSAKIVRSTWKELAKSGYGLANVCKKIGHEFAHHDALEDARAAAQIVLAASTETGLDIDGWLKRTTQPIDPSKRHNKPVTRLPNMEGPLSGEVLVFTGALTLTRENAADRAAAVGCQVANNVTRKTTLLCVGKRDAHYGFTKSAKEKKVEHLIATGQQIKVLSEADFLKLTEIEMQQPTQA